MLHVCEDHEYSVVVIYEGSSCPLCETEEENDGLTGEVADLEDRVRELEAEVDELSSQDEVDKKPQTAMVSGNTLILRGS